MTDVDEYVFPLSFAQDRLWFLDQLVPGNPFYNIASAVRMPVELDTGALVRAVNEVVRRHEALRTTFRVVDGVPMQVVAPSCTVIISRWSARPIRTTQTRSSGPVARSNGRRASAPASRAASASRSSRPSCRRS